MIYEYTLFFVILFQCISIVNSNIEFESSEQKVCDAFLP